MDFKRSITILLRFSSIYSLTNIHEQLFILYNNTNTNNNNYNNNNKNIYNNKHKF